MKKLTMRQQQILELISRAIKQAGFPPTRAEIANELGFRSVNAAEEHLQTLARKGVIEMTPGVARGIRLLQANRETAADFSQRYLVPLVGRVVAGFPIFDKEHVESTFHLDSALFSEKPDFLFRMRGLSMQDMGILEGDLIAVKKAKDAREGQIVVARLGDEVTIKRFKKTGNYIELHSENPDFEPIVVRSDTEDFSLEGVVVGLVRSMQ